jgi:hypothetical protein
MSTNIECPDPVLPLGAQGLLRVAVNDAAAQLVLTFAGVISASQQTDLLNPRSYSLSGGQRLFPRVLEARMHNPPGTPPDLFNRRILLQLNQTGDFSIYTLFVTGAGIDPFFASRKLRFRLACDDAFDCRPPAAPVEPEPDLQVVIDYLAKDYSSFRQALLDFIPTRLPDWTERSEADIGMMLLELFAATADTLSYMQDRVANEAFLASATQRRSVAGHLDLIGYEMDQGSAAHTWLQFRVNSTQTLASQPGLRVSNRPLRDNEHVIVFETHGRLTMRPEHNEMPVFNWGNQKCCLPRTALSATLQGEFSRLQAGDYILLDDRQGHRDVVRLVAKPEIVEIGNTSPPNKLTVIRWSIATPLHHEFCADKIVASGNLMLATHGETVDETLRDLTPEEQAELSSALATRRNGQTPRERLRLSSAPLAFLDTDTVALFEPLTTTRQTKPAGTKLVSDFLAREARAKSTLELRVEGFPNPWTEQRSLLDSRADEQVYRLEIDDQGEATVVFGNGVFGLRPDETTKVTARYRVGGGSIGNVAAESLIEPRPRTSENISWLVSVTNPLPATGGRDLESRDHARRIAPATFQKPLVAVTEADYRDAALEFELDGKKPIQNAKANFRWTGSWLTLTLAVDPRGTDDSIEKLRQPLLDYLDTRRLAGYDLEVIGAIYLPVDLAIEFCLKPGFIPADVQEEIERALSISVLPDGSKGLFHPDNFSFGDYLYVSRIFKAVMAVAGVESATITRLARLHAARPDRDTKRNLQQGFLVVGADQIIRLDNDRNFPENGTLFIHAKGVGE